MKDEKVLKDDQLSFTDEAGNEVLCDIIFTYHSEETNKDYVFFSEVGSEDEEGRVQVGVASYIPNPTDGTIGELNAVESDEEWDMLEGIFANYMEESECECDCDECDCEECDDDGDCGCGCHCGCNHDDK